MNREDIICMAQEAGFDYSGTELTWESVICTEELERFATLVASAAVRETSAEYRLGWNDGQIAEREACAKLIETTELGGISSDPKLQNFIAALLFGYAQAIRARGQA
jgi:hypothetical protein